MNDMSEPPNIVIRTRNLTRTVKGDSLFKNVARLKLSNKKKGNQFCLKTPNINKLQNKAQAKQRKF